MKLTNGLNLDAVPSATQTGDLRYAENVVLDNTFRFPMNEAGMLSCDIDLSTVVGVINYDKGIIIFCKNLYNEVLTPCIKVIDTNFKTEPFERLVNTIIIPQITFSVNEPIRGTTSYNQNGDLIIIFGCGVDGSWDDKIINIKDYVYINSIYTLNNVDYYQIDLNPTISFPKIGSSIIKGSLLAGSYQIAVSYKIGNEYTNYSLLSLPNYIYDGVMTYDGNDGSSPNTITTNGILYTFDNLDLNYIFFRIGIIYNNGTSFKVYTSKDISTNINNYKLSNTNILSVGSLDETLIKSIFYSNSESFNVMNNRLYRANIKSNVINQFDTIAKNIANNLSLKLVTTNLNFTTPANTDYINSKDIYSKQFIKFQSNEVYALYFTIGDKKGNVIGSYPINTNNLSGGLTKVSSTVTAITCKVTSDNAYLNHIFTLNKIVSVDTTISYTETTYSIMSNNSVVITVRNLTAIVLANTSYVYKLISSPESGGTYSRGSAKVVVNSITPSTDGTATILDYAYLIPDENSAVADDTHINYTINDIEVELPSNIIALLGSMYNNIGFWCIHRAERNNSNSKIYTQGLATAGSLQKTIEAGVVDELSKYWFCNPYVYWDDQQYSEYSYFNHGLLKTDKYPVRFYSFEDLFNRNSNFPTNTKIEVISRYYASYLQGIYKGGSYSTTRGSSIWVSYNTTIDEKKYIANSNISEQQLLEDNNIAIHNFYQESARELKLEDNSTNFTVAKNGVVNTDNAKRIFRCNVYNPTTDYYSNIYEETLILCTSINRIVDTIIIVKGDTFYSDFYLRFKRLVPNTPNSIAKLPVFDTSKLFDEPYLDTIKTEYNIRFLVESKYNIHARYWKGTYPKYDNPIKTSEQEGYNKVYHLQNNENLVTPVDIVNDLERKKASNKYNSRIVKSIISNSESNQLGFRKYLALDYYDMPYNRGAIRNIESTYKNMYIQQELGLAIASVKDVINYQEGTTYVGSGELFDRQPVEVIPTKYGFIGCESHFNCGINDKGFWTIDNVQGIISLVTDNDVKLISEGKNKNWFKEHLKGNNPFIGDGCFITYDIDTKRLILSIGQDYTLSYVPEIENWYSFHFYKYYYGLYTRNRTYFLVLRNTVLRLFKYDKSVSGEYSDLKHTQNNIINQMILSFYYNEEPGINKLWESIYWNTKCLINNFDIYDKSFTKLFVHNDTQCTDEMSIFLNDNFYDTSGGVYKEEMWIFNKLDDYVVNNHKPFLDGFVNFLVGDLDNNISHNKEWFDISKIMSTFVCVTLFFDNLYYSKDGKQKSVIDLGDTTYKPRLMLQDLYIKYKPDNR